MAELETQLDPLKLFVCRDNAEAEAGGGGLLPSCLGWMLQPAALWFKQMVFTQALSWWCESSIVPPVSCGDHVISVQPLDAITIDQSAPACGGRVLVQIYGTTLRSDGL